MMMDGDTMDVGAVAGLRRIKNVISVARKVLTHTYHSLIVGDSATAFAVSQGFKEMSLTTSHSAEAFTKWLKTKKPDYYKPVDEAPNSKHNNFGHDTIGMIAMDKTGSIACGTSTNGASFKIPGRVGDSPIAGAGAYCQTGVGGAAATGDGDQLMRFLPSFAAVNYMAAGMSPTKACEKAVVPIKKFYPHADGAVICMNAKGEYGGAKLGFPTW
jgi:isoaspartyl peptidase/L-asparaginase-like protein (Ntn-hydrolase superfamily)